MLNRISRGTFSDIFLGSVILGGFVWAYNGLALIRQESYYDVYGKLTISNDAMKMGVFFILLGLGLSGLGIFFLKNLPCHYPIGTSAEWNACIRKMIDNGKKDQ